MTNHGESYPDLEYLGSVYDADTKDFSKNDSYPVHIKNKLDPKVCGIFMSDDTFKFKTVGYRSKQFEVKLEDVQYERVDHKNKILTVVSKAPPEYSYSVHYFFSFASIKSKLSLYTPLQILEVS